MVGYLYVVSAPAERGLKPSKIGVSSDLRTRLARLRSDSAAPWPWEPWQAFRLESIEHARKLELLVKNDTALLPLRMYGKLEHFDCLPNVIAERVVALASANSIGLLKGFPFTLSMIQGMSGDFPSLPTEIVRSLPEDARKAYWQGAQDVLRVLTYLDGLVLQSEELWELWGMLKSNAEVDEPQLSATISGFYRNRSSPRNRRVAEDAVIRMANDERTAWEDWQE